MKLENPFMYFLIKLLVRSKLLKYIVVFIPHVKDASIVKFDRIGIIKVHIGPLLVSKLVEENIAIHQLLHRDITVYQLN